MEETGKRFSPASYVVMKQMGYEGPARERELHEEYTKTLHLESEERERRAIEAEEAEQRKARSFDEAIQQLPDEASASATMAWIKAHPAMSRQDRQQDKLSNIRITAEDLLNPPHGRAPSKAAGIQLQHWVNRPGEFNKQLLSEQKKNSAGPQDTPEEQDPGLGEVEKMLETVESRRR